MLRKTGFLIVTLVLLCVLLTGCVETNIGVRIDGKDGGDLSTTLLIAKDFYAMMQGGDISGLDGMTEGETTVDGTEYVTFSKTKSYKTYAEMETALIDMSFLDTGSGTDETNAAGIFKSVEIKKDGWLFENRYTFYAVTNAQETDEEMAMNGMSFGDIFKLQLEVTMPDSISESKGGKAEGNTLKCDITNLAQENEITAVSKSMNTVAIVITVILIILIIGVFLALSGKGGAEKN